MNVPARERARLLDGRVAIVTGAGRGIGFAIARRFLAHGARVALHARTWGTSAGIEQALAESRAVVVAGDLRIDEERARLFDEVDARFGRLDVLVNNAGVQRFDGVADADPDEFRAMLEVNTVAAVDCMRRGFAMMRGGEGDRSIVNIVSVRASRPGPGAALYAATKAALLAASRAAAVEFGPSGIRVNAVSPGLVARPGLEHDWPEGVASYREQAPLRRIGDPDDVADACVMLASPLASWVTGAELVVDGGISLVR